MLFIIIKCTYSVLIHSFCEGVWICTFVRGGSEFSRTVDDDQFPVKKHATWLGFGFNV